MEETFMLKAMIIPCMFRIKVSVGG